MIMSLKDAKRRVSDDLEGKHHALDINRQALGLHTESSGLSYIKCVVLSAADQHLQIFKRSRASCPRKLDSWILECVFNKESRRVRGRNSRKHSTQKPDRIRYSEHSERFGSSTHRLWGTFVKYSWLKSAMNLFSLLTVVLVRFPQSNSRLRTNQEWAWMAKDQDGRGTSRNRSGNQKCWKRDCCKGWASKGLFLPIRAQSWIARSRAL